MLAWINKAFCLIPFPACSVTLQSVAELTGQLAGRLKTMPLKRSPLIERLPSALATQPVTDLNQGALCGERLPLYF